MADGHDRRADRQEGLRRGASLAPASAREPRVPEVEPRRRAKVAAQVAARHVEGEVVAELHVADVFVEDGLDALDDRLALLRIALEAQLAEQELLLFVAPAAPEGATQR